MTEKKMRNKRKLSQEILGLLAITFLIASALLQILSLGATGIVENTLFMKDIVLTDIQMMKIDSWIWNVSLLVSVIFFVVLFLFLLGERLSYIKEIFQGIDALQNGQEDYMVPVEGNNELTRLAEGINDLSFAQRQVREKARMLSMEKEQFIRELSHDIRTPLTSIISYSELLSETGDLPKQKQIEYLKLIGKKAGQIRELSDVLLDGSRRNPERFEDALLLIAQLSDDFEMQLEDEFRVSVDLTRCSPFAGMFDVQELQRITDNLISNIRKYANPDKPVTLSVGLEEQQLVLRQKNSIRQQIEPTESYQIGLRSIRRIVQNYHGRVEVQKDDTEFAITITFSEF